MSRVIVGVTNVSSCFALGGGGGNAASQQGLMTKLQQIIQSNRLEAFFPPQKLHQLVDRLTRLDFRYHLLHFLAHLLISFIKTVVCVSGFGCILSTLQGLSCTACLLQRLVACSLSSSGGVLRSPETGNTADSCITA